MKINELLEKIKDYAITKNYNIYDVAACTRKQNITSITINKKEELPDSYSVAKAFCVCAIGMLYDEGRIDVTTPITTVLRKYINYDYTKTWDIITIHNCLKHRLGIKEGTLDIDCNNPSIFGDDYLKYVMNEKFVYEPAKDFIYTDAAFYLISRIIYELAGMDVEDYLREKLFKPLRIENEIWKKCPYGYSMGATGLYMSSYDTVKLPALYLNDGVWKNERLLSHEWMELLDKYQYENYYTEENGWRQKGGMLGQMVMYNNDYDCAISWHGHGNFGAEIRQFVFDLVKEKIED